MPSATQVVTMDSPLGRWTLATWRPDAVAADPGAAALAQVVEHLWYFEGHVALPRERTFPGGYVELIAHLGPRYRPVDPAGAAGGCYPTVCASGVQTAPVVIEAPAGPSRVLGVRLRPVGAHALLGCPLSTLTDRTHDLAALLGPAADELAERCHDARSPEACLARAGAWVHARVRAGRAAVHPAVAGVAAALERAHGVASVTRLRDATGLGRSRFAELFRTQVGLGAKRYARILRFRRALALLHAGTPGRAWTPDTRATSLSALALDVGYYDHAHLDADFREFAGMAPSVYAARSRFHEAPSIAEPR